MEILFFWFNNDYKTLKNTGLTLSSRFLFSFNINDKKRTFELDVKPNPDYLAGFFSDNITDITAIIGDNGVGKSNILGLLSDFLTIDYLFFRNWVSAFWNSEEKRIELHYNLYFNESNNTFIDGWKLDITNKNDILINVVKVGNQSPSRYLPPRKNIVNISNAKIIKYSPILDFRNTPPEENSDNNLIDVSTNYLIYSDSDDFYLTTRDKLELHKHKNIERQYELSLSALSELPELNIPKEMEVRFEKARKVEYSDLPSPLRFFFEEFRKDISSRFNDDYNNRIEQAKGWREKEKALLSKVYYWFLINLLENYLQHLSFIKDLGGKSLSIQPDDFKVDDVKGTIISFLRKQDWVDFDFFGFINYVNKLIDDTAFLREGDYNDNEAYFMLPAEKVGEMWSWHMKLLDSYKKVLHDDDSRYIKEFIHLNWRTMSSGEKAILDLYSRLYFAYNKFVEDDKTDFLYLMIDEGEHGFHPRWQKEYIKRLVSFLEYLAPGKKIQIFLTTHSPIIVSDLPKGNLIFIKKDSTQDSHITNLNNHEQTFGANIHSLYSDAFFMDDGLIGEFAKEKILGWFTDINSIKENKLSKEKEVQYRKYLNLIGEPLLKKRMIDLLDSKTIVESPEEKIARLKKEIEQTKKEMENYDQD